MLFPYYVTTLSKKEVDIFNKHFVYDGKFYFEGIWFREQRKENAKFSNYKDKQDKRRRYFHFYDCYEISYKDDKEHLAITGSYMYLSNTLLKEEIKEYEESIRLSLNEGGFKQNSENYYTKGDLEVRLVKYLDHPKNIENDVVFPKNYMSLDIIVRADSYDYIPHYERMWELSMRKEKYQDRKEKPKYAKSIKEITKYLPAQIEVGCGFSSESKIPNLNDLYEIFKIQDVETNKFYFAQNDTFLQDFLKAPEKGYKTFSNIIKSCIKAKPSKSHEKFAKIYNNGYFVGNVFSNGFDRIVNRFDIEEKNLRIDNIEPYNLDSDFDKNAKSLICIGVHNDKNHVQRKARERNLKVIYIDPEEITLKNKIFPKKLEGAKKEDIIYKQDFSKAMDDLLEELGLN